MYIYIYIYLIYIYTDKTTKHGPSAQFAKTNRAIVQGATVGALSASVISIGLYQQKSALRSRQPAPTYSAAGN